jgi:hypothetical protein
MGQLPMLLPSAQCYYKDPGGCRPRIFPGTLPPTASPNPPNMWASEKPNEPEQLGRA